MANKRSLKQFITLKNIISTFVLLSLLGSIVYAAINISTAQSGAIPETEHGRLKSDYVLMLAQCVLGVLIMFLPSLISKRLKFEMANWIYLTYILFLYCAIYLGEVRNLYNRLPHWDTILHLFSGGMLGALGFYVVSLMNRSKNINVTLSPATIAVFAFCFAMTLGTIWEMYEFVFDGMLGLNMQKHSLESGAPLMGREALSDTMKDLIVDAAGTLIVTVGEYFFLKKGKSLVINKNATIDNSITG